MTNLEKILNMDELSAEECRQIAEAQKENDPLWHIAKSLNSIDKTLKHIEEQLKKRRV